MKVVIPGKVHTGRSLARSLLLLLLWLLPGHSCMLYNDFNLSGDYRLGGGFYYDGTTFPLEDYQGSLKLKDSKYTISYSISFEKKSGEVVNEMVEENGRYGHTSESERTIYGTNEKFWSGLIFFYPDTGGGYGEGYSMKYEYLIRSKRLILDNSAEFTVKGYYTELEWVEK